MNKKISVFLAIFFLGFFIYYGSYVSQAKGNNDVPVMQIAQTLLDKDVAVTSWSLYTKEEVPSVTSKETFVKKSDELKFSLKGFKWELKRERDVWKAVGLHYNKDSEMMEEVQLVSTLKNKTSDSYILYHVAGKAWDKHQWNLGYDQFQKNYHKIFTFNPKIFSCVKGQFNDNMKSVLSLGKDELLEAFKAKTVESLVEETFVSVSAYTGMWKEVLPTKNNKMNLQIALRKTGLGGQTTVVVGTPIITSEY
ncbi:YwmB family TATA-box binding protein [Priestia koreensis]|uniref:YwmB family TATA-box binding protein n=1 Tax=Priestia koreensis TaxID=284581 RepID=UPI001F56EDD6|nr:YwmB family TATA-box binding protein [Priestia koreensis]MCM3004650.1 YwmB family TATA-box binding protein [Priestia koreensis]UNL84860.1 YwmB family TATA-box binding protein [Priestia koreensis]